MRRADQFIGCDAPLSCFDGRKRLAIVEPELYGERLLAEVPLFAQRSQAAGDSSL
ncbi:MAG TPA: hypothetical protein VEY93_03520 [Longimicrobium sp.]|nr:hypothetical protein [Longimicrobium sp.]